jgi:hypothetical protein
VHTFIRRQGGGAIPYDEALQAGRIGPWRALRGYDPEQEAFTTCAWVTIVRHIQQVAEDLNGELGEWPEDVPTSWEEPPAEDWVE